jgi:hypothetical protein
MASWWFSAVEPGAVTVRVIGDTVVDGEAGHLARTLRLCLAERTVERVVLDLSGFGDAGVLEDVILVARREAEGRLKSFAVLEASRPSSRR